MSPTDGREVEAWLCCPGPGVWETRAAGGCACVSGGRAQAHHGDPLPMGFASLPFPTRPEPTVSSPPTPTPSCGARSLGDDENIGISLPGRVLDSASRLHASHPLSGLGWVDTSGHPTHAGRSLGPQEAPGPLWPALTSSLCPPLSALPSTFQFFTCLVILFACEVAAGIWGFVNKDQVSQCPWGGAGGLLVGREEGLGLRGRGRIAGCFGRALPGRKPTVGFLEEAAWRPSGRQGHL